MRIFVEMFAKAMEEKLKTKDEELGEDGWMGNPNTDIDYLLERLECEVRELKDAYKDCKPNGIMAEAVDIGNFAMMIYTRLIRITERFDSSK